MPNKWSFQHLLEKLPAGAYTCDAEGLITYYNPYAMHLWGRAPRLNDPVDRYCGSFKLFSMDGAPLPHDQCWMALALRQGREYADQEITIERPDGRRIVASANASPMYDASGQLLGAVNILVDITSLKDTERALRQSEERLLQLNQSLEKSVQERTGQLLANQRRLRQLTSRLSVVEQRERKRIAMDLHDKLAQLLVVCKLKLHGTQEDLQEKRGQSLEEIDYFLDEALRYTRSLISDLSPPFDLQSDSLPDAMCWVAARMKECGLSVRVEDDGQPKPMDPETLTVTIDAARELLFNVLRHSGVKSAHLIVRRSGDRILVSVIDEGAGFDPAAAPFEQSQCGGFGLFSIRERLNTSGGTLQVHSAPGKGTRVTLSVPLLERPAARPEPALSSLEPPGGSS